MDREPAEARFCAECNRCHSAEEGDLWAESSMLGLRITYFACMDGKVYDITGISISSFKTYHNCNHYLTPLFFVYFTCCDVIVFQSGQVAKE